MVVLIVIVGTYRIWEGYEARPELRRRAFLFRRLHEGP